MNSLQKIWVAMLLLLFGQQGVKAQCPAPFPLMTTKYDCLTSSAYTTFTITAGTAPYTYTFVNTVSGSTITGSSAVSTGTTNGLPTGPYSVMFVDATGCTSNSSYTVSLNSSVTSILFTNSGSVTCNGTASGTAIAVPPTSFSGLISYTWTPGGYNTQSVTTLSANVVYSVTATDSKGCGVTNTLMLGEPAPIVSTLTNTYLICFGSSGPSTITSTGNVGTTNYTVNGTALSGSVATVSAGVQTLVTRDSKGCVVTNTILVDQGAQPILTFSITKPSCPGISDGSIAPAVASAPPSYAYTWQPGNANTQVLSNIPSGTYTLSVLDGNSCLTKSTTVVLPALSATVTPVTTPENCSAADGAFTLNVSGVSPPFTFTTLPLGPHSSSVITGLSSGSYTTVTLYNGSCIDTLRFTIGNLSAVTVSVQNVFPIKCYNNCTGSVSVIVSNAVNPVTYSASGTPSTNSNVITNLCAGFYVIKVVDANGCPATTTVNFAQPPAFTYTATGPNSACAGQPVTMQASATGGSGGYTYVWNPGNISGQVVNVTPSGSTVYSLNAYDSQGCTQTPVQLTVTVKPPISVSLNSAGAGICPGTTAQITPTVSGGDGNYNYQWLPGNATTPSIFVENITVPTYTFIVKDGCGSPTAIKIININLLPVTKPTFVAGLRGCQPFCNTFINTTPRSNSVVWNYGDRPYEKAGDTTLYCYAKAGVYDLKISLVDSNNCKTSFTYSRAIEVLAKPKADFITEPVRLTLRTANDVTIKNLTDEALSYSWWVDGRSFASTKNINYTFSDTGCYKFMLIAENANSCIDTAQKYLCVLEDFNFFMPNCFTPNGSGLNDVLMPQGTGWVGDNYLFEVFNRWGARVFKTNSITTGWDGYNSGQPTPYDSFIWHVSITDIQAVQHDFRGQVYLLR